MTGGGRVIKGRRGQQRATKESVKDGSQRSGIRVRGIFDKMKIKLAIHKTPPSGRLKEKNQGKNPSALQKLNLHDLREMVWGTAHSIRNLLMFRSVRGQLPIGLVLEGDRLVFCEIAHYRNGFRAKRLVIRKLDGIRFPVEGESVIAFINELRGIVQNAGWRGRKVALSAPAEFVILRHITLPPMKNKMLKMAIQSEVEHNMSFPFANPRYDHVVLDADSCIGQPDDPSMNAIIVAAGNDDLELYANCVRQTGLVPIRMEPCIMGIQRLVVTSGEVIERHQLYVVLYLRFDGVEFGFFEGENLLFMRHMDQKPSDYPRDQFANISREGEAQLDDSMSLEGKLPDFIEEFDLASYASDLGYEIDRSMNFVHFNLIKNEARVSLIYLTSALLDVEPIVAVWQSHLEQEVRVIESQLIFDRPEHAPEPWETPWTVESAHFATDALGLALPEVSG